jgi:hypothetical protein
MRIYASTMKGIKGMISSRENVEQSQRVAVQFLIAELNVGMTFLDVAGVTARGDTRTRNEQNARTAYETVVRLLPRVAPTRHEFPDLYSKLGELRDRLQALGCVDGRGAESPASA